MAAIRQACFDKLADEYDSIWSETAIGRAQRSAVWRCIDPLFTRGDLVLDLGCGTGVDALHLHSRGVSVYGIDESPGMVAIAKRRGVDAQLCAIERLDSLDLVVDGVISNFGALNCLPSLTSLSATLARIVRRGGYMALCLLNRFCLWEIAFHLLGAQPSRAFRRLKARATSSIGVTVFYPSYATIVSAFKDSFRLINSFGIGLFVPPSYIRLRSPWFIAQLSKADRHVAHLPVLRSLADHRLYIFQRV
jgi:ubiquinone/menaquinone biosynthesis C-methylase UbiE